MEKKKKKKKSKKKIKKRRRRRNQTRRIQLTSPKGACSTNMMTEIISILMLG